jgi:hypothetical protein
MSSFNGNDYDKLFSLGAKLYTNNFNRTIVREIATTLMAMCESVRGQQTGWPNIAKRYRHLTNYATGEIIKFPKRPNSKGL